MDNLLELVAKSYDKTIDLGIQLDGYLYFNSNGGRENEY